MDEIFDRIKATKVNRKYLIISLVSTEILGILILIWFLRTPLSQKFLVANPKSYNVVSLDSKKRYLLSQGDYLTGTAIPNTKVKVLVTPSFKKDQISSSSKGEWWYQISPDIKKGSHTITFGNFDNKNKLVTFQSYKFRVQSNISPLVIVETFLKKLSSIFSAKKVSAQMNSGTLDLHTRNELPPPSFPTELSADQQFRFREYFLPYAYTAAKIINADWRLMGMWALKEAVMTNYLDNCLDANSKFGPDADFDSNTVCTAWGREGLPNWQVGWGIYPYQWADRLPEAMAVMRPGKTIQEIGQEVIDNSHDPSRYAESGGSSYKYALPITQPNIFPSDVTLEEIVEGAKPLGEDGDRIKTCRPKDSSKNRDDNQDPKDCFLRQLYGILLKDPAISAYLLALNWKEVFDNYLVAAEIDRQGGYKPQESANLIAGIEKAAAGVDLDAIVITPRITVPVVVQVPATQDTNSSVGGLLSEVVISQDGIALDEQGVNSRNIKVEKVVIPYGTYPGDFYQPTAENNVRGLSSTSEISLEHDEAENPDNYKLCFLLKTVDYDRIIDSDCIPLNQIIDPQIIFDPSASDQSEISNLEIEEAIFKLQFPEETEALSCEPSNWQDEQPYSCQDGYACYNRWKTSGSSQCIPEPDYDKDGKWYVCFENPDCGIVSPETPVSEQSPEEL